MSDFIVSARKYRPGRFDEVIGQNHVARTLKNALRTDHLAHAFLFCGPRGVGKTSCARILAKTLNCQNITDDFEPCGTCNSCKSFSDNTSFNVIELDAASHNSVEHMRTLVEQVRFQPQQGKYKIFIIDEVHMLSTSAFNAFLKTLEEPPPYAIFILATTEKHKILPTILSRCQIFDFKRIQVADIVTQLESICKSEGIEAEPDALIVIGQKADGALRDALSIFDRIISLSGDRLAYNDVIESLNILDYDYYFKVTDAVMREDLPEVFRLYHEILNNGFEGDLFINGLASHLRDLLMCKDPKTLVLLDFGDQIKDRYSKQASVMTHGQLMSFLHLVNECDINYPKAQNKRLHVEITLSKMCYLGRMKTVSLSEPANGAQKKTPDTTVASKTKEIEQKKPIPPVATGVESAIESEASKVSTAEPLIIKPAAPDGNKIVLNTPRLNGIHDLHAVVEEQEKKAKANQVELNKENILDCWNQYIESVQSPSVKSTLMHAIPDLVEGKISIAVGTQTARTRITEETELIEKLRSLFHDESIELHVWVDPALDKSAPVKKPKKLLTNREKYEFLVKKNPYMVDLKRKLDLIVDQDT